MKRRFVKFPSQAINASESVSSIPSDLAARIFEEFERTDTGFAVENTILEILELLPGVTGTDEYFMSGYVGVSFTGSAQKIFDHLFNAYKEHSGMVVGVNKRCEFYIEGTEGSGDTWISVSKDPQGNTYTAKDKAYAVHIEYFE